MAFFSRKDRRGLLVPERKIMRWRRLVECHTEVMDVWADLREKRSGTYILDRHYVEARLDTVYERIRQLIYDASLISEGDGERDYDELEANRRAIEILLKEPARRLGAPGEEADEGEAGGEVLVVRSVYGVMTAFQGAYPHDIPAEVHKVLPRSGLIEMVGVVHERAASSLHGCLSTVSSPTTVVGSEGQPDGLFPLDVFLLSGVSAPEHMIDGVFSGGPCADREPLCAALSYFVRGIVRGRLTEGGSGRFTILRARKAGGAAGAGTRARLYVGDAFFLLWLPAPSPLRLVACALSGVESEHLLYLYGCCPAPEGSAAAHLYRSSGKAAFPAYGYRLSERWFVWGSRFSWVQGESLLHLLGHAMGPDFAPGGVPAPTERAAAFLQHVLEMFNIASQGE